jgi:hypothetical protein
MSFNRAGKRTLKRRAMNERLKRRSIELGIDSCEIKLEGCLRKWALSWAHSKKSRFIVSDSDWMEAVLACPSCHAEIEGMSHEEMKRIVTETISKRNEHEE